MVAGRWDAGITGFRSQLADGHIQEALTVLGELEAQGLTIEIFGELFAEVAAARTECPAQVTRALADVSSQFFELASQDPENGPDLADSLVSLLLTTPGLEWDAAGAAYNRGALLRRFGRRDDAQEAFRFVVDAFGEDPELRYWVVYALINHAQMMEDVPDVALPLVRRLREEYRPDEHPDIRERLIRAATLEDRLVDDPEFLPEWMRTERDHILRMLREVDPDTPNLDGLPRVSRDELALVMVYWLSEALGVVRQLDDAPPSEWLGVVCAHPELLTGTGQVALREAAEGAISGAGDEADRERLRRGLFAIGSVLGHLEEDMSRHRTGDGPIEGLISNAGVTASLDDVLEGAGSLEWVRVLTLPYAVGICRDAMAWLDRRDWHPAATTMRVLLAVAEHLPDSVDGDRIRRVVRGHWLVVARGALIEVPDPQLMDSAVAAGERLLRQVEADGEPTDLAEVLLALGNLYVSPYGGGRLGGSFRENLRRWQERQDEQGVAPDGRRLPDITDALDTGEAYLRRALPIAAPGDVPHVLHGLLNVHDIRVALGGEPDPDERRGLARRMAATADPESEPQLFLQGWVTLAEMGEAPSLAYIEPLLRHPIEEIAERTSTSTAAAVLQTGADLLARLAPARARQLIGDSVAFIRSLDESRRSMLLSIGGGMLFDQADCPDQLEDPQKVFDDLIRRGDEEGWSEERYAVALCTAALAGNLKAPDADTAELWLFIVDIALERFPEFATAHGDAARFMRIGCLTQLAMRAAQEGQYDQAFRCMANSAEAYLTLDLPDAAMESLGILVQFLTEHGGAGLSRTAANHLAHVVVRAENAIGAPATTALQAIWRRVIATNGEPGELDGDGLVVCLQLAKGLRFVQALHADQPYDWSTDERAQAMRRLLDQLPPGPAAADMLDQPTAQDAIDAVTLVTPYSERLETFGAIGEAEARENIERSFDTRVIRQLTAGAHELVRPLLPRQIRDMLPADAVLLMLYFGEDSGGMPTTWSVVSTTERTAVVPQQLGEARQYEYEAARRIRIVDFTQASVHVMRSRILEEPGPVRPVTRAGHELLDGALYGHAGPVVDLLHQEYAAGRRHLIVVPHGALHLSPLHLWHLDGRPLAETWKVTYLPALGLLPPRATPDREFSDLVAVGLGFADTAHPIPEAVAEATAVAATFGGIALLDDAATGAAVLAALGTSRYFHLASHGLHNVPAPSFQCLYVSDGRIDAYQTLALDLHGVELVTLSACETALGRFDTADNLRGIPANLLTRGVEAIVGTLWPVETTTSFDFFTRLYQELRAGRSRLDAFATAQAATRATHPLYRDWGAFYYTGDWR
jgi:hypothetical protein